MRRKSCYFAITGLLLLLCLVGAGRQAPTAGLPALTAPHEQDLVRWEVGNFMKKWLHLARAQVWRDAPSSAETTAMIAEFFSLGDERRRLQRQQVAALAGDPARATLGIGALTEGLDDVRSRAAELQPCVEEALEAAISAAADEMGLMRRIGASRWPPVDFTFEPGGLVLVRSPRESIRRLPDSLLRPDIPLLEQERLEREAEALDPGIAALIVRVGGVATYPAQVTPDADLHGTLIIASHEWVHHYLFFHPLGRRWWDGGELTQINETVANIVGEELGDLAYEKLTGVAVHRPPWQPPTLRARNEPPPDVFDFNREMRRTRAGLEALLAAGQVDEAEAYLEKRRRLFVANGHPIRKLNTAYFAFHGTYTDSPQSLSPIEPQLRSIRAEAGSLAAFLDRVARIDAPGQLEGLARDAGWQPRQ